MMPPLPPVVHHETIPEWWANRPAGCLFMLTAIAVGIAFIAWGIAADRRGRPARPIAEGALHTAIWSLVGAIYLTLGPDVGVVGTDGPGWIVMAASIAMSIFLRWVWTDVDAKVG
jgi:hypothetical protein